VPHGIVEALVQRAAGVLGAKLAVLGVPAKPAAEWSPLAVNRQDVRAGFGIERRLSEDKSKLVPQLIDQCATLGAKQYIKGLIRLIN
jgi:hypothetical protein